MAPTKRPRKKLLEYSIDLWPDENMMYGMKISDEQKAFRDAICDPEKEIVFCNARAGTGKTTIAVGTAVFLVRTNVYDKINYITSAHAESRQGFLPGTIDEKSKVYNYPLHDALMAANENPQQVIISDDNIEAQKSGTAFVSAMTETFLRGRNLEGIILLDESQNFSVGNLIKTLSRACKGSKVVCIGHTGQCDLGLANENAFERCMNHFIKQNDPRVAVCELTKNYRSWVASTADQPWD